MALTNLPRPQQAAEQSTTIYNPCGIRDHPGGLVAVVMGVLAQLGEIQILLSANDQLQLRAV